MRQSVAVAQDGTTLGQQTVSIFWPAALMTQVFRRAHSVRLLSSMMFDEFTRECAIR